jgi:hypothetical protein
MNEDICGIKMNNHEISRSNIISPSTVTLNEYGYHLVKNFVQEQKFQSYFDY